MGGSGEGISVLVKGQLASFCTHLGAVLTRIPTEFPVRDGPVAQQRGAVAVPPITEVATVGVLRVVVRYHQVVVQPGTGGKGVLTQKSLS